jgi:hypothetical protein
METILTWFGFFLFLIICSLINAWLDEKIQDGEDTTHHDNQPFSHYSISHQVIRDDEKRRGY